MQFFLLEQLFFPFGHVSIEIDLNLTRKSLVYGFLYGRYAID